MSQIDKDRRYIKIVFWAHSRYGKNEKYERIVELAVKKYLLSHKRGA